VQDIKVVCGDYRTVLKTLTSQSVNLVLTDPPYGVTSQDWDQPPDLLDLWGILEPLLAPKATLVMTAIQPFASDVIRACQIPAAEKA
jgi:hypothetical protein